MRLILIFAYVLFVVAMFMLYIPVICLYVLWETTKAFFKALVEAVKPFIYAIEDATRGDM